MRKTALLLLLAAAAAFATPAAPQTFQSMFAEYAVLAGVLVTIGLSLAAVAYMLGTLLSNEKIKMWSKTEMVELFYSGVLFAIVVGMYQMALGVAEGASYQVDTFSAERVCGSSVTLFNTFKIEGNDVDLGYDLLPCHMRIAKNFLATLFYEVAGLVKAVGINYSWYTFLSSVTVDFTPVGTSTFFGGAGFNHGVFAYLNAKNNALAFLFDNGVKVLTIVRFQEVLINFIAVALFPSLLAAGMVLRLFSLTRRLGGLLMALAFSLYFIYPMFYVIGDSVLNSVLLSRDCAATPETCPILSQVFLDMENAPKKLNNTNDETSLDNSAPGTVNTDGSAVASALLAQLGLYTASATCQEVKADVEAAGGGGEVPEDESAWLGMRDGNTLLGDWLSGAYLKGASWNPVYNSMSFGTILTGIKVLAKAAFFSLFFSFLAIFATIASVKSLSPMLGGDSEIAGLTHLI